MKDSTNILSKIFLFSGLTTNQLDSLSCLINYRRYQRGRIIFMEEEPGEAVFFLQAGRIKILKQDEDGRQHILHYINPGDVFAEVVLFDGGTYPATAEVIEDSVVGMIKNVDMDKLLLENPEITLALLKVMSRRLRYSQQQIMELALKDTTRRMAGALLKLSLEHGVQTPGGRLISMNLTNQELAHLVGTSRETVNRILSEFRKNKAVRVERQEMYVNEELLKSWL